MFRGAPLFDLYDFLRSSKELPAPISEIRAESIKAPAKGVPVTYWNPLTI